MGMLSAQLKLVLTCQTLVLQQWVWAHQSFTCGYSYHFSQTDQTKATCLHPSIRSSSAIPPWQIHLIDKLTLITPDGGEGGGWCHWAGRKVFAEISSLMGDRNKNLREIHLHFSLLCWQGRNGLRLTMLLPYVRENWGSACWVSYWKPHKLKLIN